MPENVRLWAALLIAVLTSFGYTAVSTRDRFTASDAARLDERVKSLEIQLRGHPPAWLVENVAAIKVTGEENRRAIQQIGTKIELVAQKLKATE